MTVFFGVLLIMMMGFAALVTDAGLLCVERRDLQNAADAAALAGARHFLFDGWTEAEVESAVKQWAAYNGLPEAQLTEVSIGVKSLPAGDLPTVTVRAQRPVNLLFAFAFGVRQLPVGVRAVAGVSPLRPLKIWPWAISQSTYNQLLQDQIANGEVFLKLSSQDNKNGNFLPLALGDQSGASVYEANIKTGWNGPLPAQVPPAIWTVPTETGNMAGPTEQGVQYLLELERTNPCTIPGNDVRCPLIGLIPVITDQSWAAAKGTSNRGDVIRFSVFQVSRLAPDPDEKGRGKGHQVVVGRFLERGTAVGPTDPDSNLKLYTVRLWE